MTGKKKEALTKFHRDTILEAAELLFQEKGLDRTTMDDIAKAAEYSKATLYVYFKNKEELISAMTLRSMVHLYEQLDENVNRKEGIQEKFFCICSKLTNFYEDHPIEFTMILEKIQVNIGDKNTPEVFKEIFTIGEKINEIIKNVLILGMKEGVLREDLEIMETLLMLWASITGIIQFSYKKQEYLENCLSIDKDKYLKKGFQLLFLSIKKQ